MFLRFIRCGDRIRVTVDVAIEWTTSTSYIIINLSKSLTELTQ
jgi:hypothetical protein